VSNYTVVFEPIGRKGECQDGESLLECARRLGIGISSICGGRGTCGTCRVQVTSGTVSEPTPKEVGEFSPQELDNGWRLACQTIPTSDCQVVIPPESLSASERIHLEGLEVAVTLEPPVKAYHLKLTAPSLSDPQADADRLLAVLNIKHQASCRKIDTSVLRSLSPQIRDLDWECRVSVRNGELVAIGPGSSRQLGLAIDLGTTTIAGYIIDLSNGQTLASLGVMNPQIGYGEDIISRIDFAVKTVDGGVRLQKLVIDRLNEMATNLCSTVGVTIDEIVEVVIVGNTAMHHLLLGLPVRQLVLTPFTAAVSMALDIKARDLGLHIAPGAYIHLLPNIAGFVGADHVADLLVTYAGQVKGLTISLDIGTNTEISLINGDEITSTSCASGPAFEGGHIKQGMRAAKGAIERIRIIGDTVNYQTIGEAPPIGICGSGVLDALAQLYLAGAITNSGRFTDKHPRVRGNNNQLEFVIVEREEEGKDTSIVMTQKDIRELQLAKAAIRSGIQLLLEVNGFSEEDIQRVVVAGAFGTYIDHNNRALTSITTKLFPAGRKRCWYGSKAITTISYQA
jgi:uncharacterized 2Fe-2S/4Fe-4S cluster protein (DUF4445 family)